MNFLRESTAQAWLSTCELPTPGTWFSFPHPWCVITIVRSIMNMSGIIPWGRREENHGETLVDGSRDNWWEIVSHFIGNTSGTYWESCHTCPVWDNSVSWQYDVCEASVWWQEEVWETFLWWQSYKRETCMCWQCEVWETSFWWQLNVWETHVGMT